MKKLSFILIAGAMFAACNQAAKVDTSAADSTKMADSMKMAAAKAVATMDSSSMKKDSTAAPAKMEDKKEKK